LVLVDLVEIQALQMVMVWILLLLEDFQQPQMVVELADMVLISVVFPAAMGNLEVL
jgi:hypothetical protein